MEIPQELKERLLAEFDFIIKKMREESEASKKMYFFSATYGAVERVMRYYPSNELFIAHAILNLCYNTLNDRINRVKSGDVNVPLPQDWAEQLVSHVGELKKAIQGNSSVYPALEGIIQLTYFVTGPGFYTKIYKDYIESQEQKQEA